MPSLMMRRIQRSRTGKRCRFSVSRSEVFSGESAVSLNEWSGGRFGQARCQIANAIDEFRPDMRHRRVASTASTTPIAWDLPFSDIREFFRDLRS
jgi:hypothetical protein